MIVENTLFLQYERGGHPCLRASTPYIENMALSKRLHVSNYKSSFITSPTRHDVYTLCLVIRYELFCLREPEERAAAWEEIAVDFGTWLHREAPLSPIPAPRTLRNRVSKLADHYGDKKYFLYRFLPQSTQLPAECVLTPEQEALDLREPTPVLCSQSEIKDFIRAQLVYIQKTVHCSKIIEMTQAVDRSGRRKRPPPDDVTEPPAKRTRRSVDAESEGSLVSLTDEQDSDADSIVLGWDFAPSLDGHKKARAHARVEPLSDTEWNGASDSSVHSESDDEPTRRVAKPIAHHGRRFARPSFEQQQLDLERDILRDAPAARAHELEVLKLRIRLAELGRASSLRTTERLPRSPM